MTKQLVSETYEIVILTDSYAGNFERAMCAYTTGVLGECEVGYEEAQEFKQEIDSEIGKVFKEIVGQRADDHGCHRPVRMSQVLQGDPNYGTTVTNYGGRREFANWHNVTIFFDQEPINDTLRIIQERAKAFAERKGIKFYGLRKIRETVEHETVMEMIE